MFTRPIGKVGVACLLACAGLLAGGCNIDGLWADRDVPEGPVARQPAPGETDNSQDFVADAEEVDLVEQLVAHREAYHAALLRLRDYYQQRGNATKLAWAEFELKGVRNVTAFRYIMDAEVPSESLRPTDSIAAANALYDKGVELMRKGGHGIPGVFRRDLMVEAAGVFRELITQYPTSDKIDDAAFFEGEIYKEYLPGLERIALEWYKRAWTWDPETPHPARFQAAVVSDYRLHDRDRALELYHEVITIETADRTNVRFAMRRIYELTQDSNARADAG